MYPSVTIETAATPRHAGPQMINSRCNSACMEPDAESVLHVVAGELAPTVDELIDLTSVLLDRSRPELTDPGSDPDHPAAVFAPYVDVSVCFADARTRAAGLVAPSAAELMPAILEYAREARWGKAPLSRQSARARVLTA